MAPVPPLRMRRWAFLCLVNCDRDRPQLPTPAELAELRRTPEVAAFIRT
ncbi:MAG: hypothetical protein R3A44_41820 [Caldilineaceae bacterium]